MQTANSTKKTWLRSWIVTMILFSLLTVNCENQNPLGPNESAPVNNWESGIPVHQISWLSWHPEVIQSLSQGNSYEMERKGSDFELINTESGGFVGGNITFDNQVVIPGAALTEDTWIAVQVTCPLANEFYLDYNTAPQGDLMSSMVETLSILAAELGPISEITTAQSALAEVQIYFEVYAYLTKNNVFSLLKDDIILEMKALAEEIADGELAVEYLPLLQDVSEDAALASRWLSQSSLDFALYAPNSNPAQIVNAQSDLDQGDVLMSTPDDEFDDDGVEWFEYHRAVSKYKKSWKDSRDAVPGLNAPSAAVDFLPNMQFEDNVEITLSWDNVELPEEGGNLEYGDFEVFYSEDGGEFWFPIEELTIDENDETITFEIDHFTRYAWGLRDSQDNLGDDDEGQN